MTAKNKPDEVKNETPKDEMPKAAPAKKVITSLYFPEGFWCKELNQSFSIGYYKPKDEKELNLLRKFAGKEVSNLKPSM